MNQVTRRGGRRGTYAAAAVTVALLVVGVLALVVGFRGSDGPPQPVAVAAAPSSTSTEKAKPTASATPDRTTNDPSRPGAKKSAAKQSSGPRVGRFLPASAPVALEIPSIDVKSSNFVDLQVGKNGTIDVPGSADEVGFYTGGPTPGQIGPAVLGAHVDSTKGPGIFYNLGAVKPGAKIHITRQDKTRATFVVDRVALYPKDDFPTEAVYHSDFDRAEIRLVTCGGTFHPVKHYLDNVVVFGHLTSVA
jgi:sortase (surface protein transpeptidase)